MRNAFGAGLAVVSDARRRSTLLRRCCRLFAEVLHCRNGLQLLQHSFAGLEGIVVHQHQALADALEKKAKHGDLQASGGLEVSGIVDGERGAARGEPLLDVLGELEARVTVGLRHFFQARDRAHCPHLPRVVVLVRMLDEPIVEGFATGQLEVDHLVLGQGRKEGDGATHGGVPAPKCAAPKEKPQNGRITR